MLAAAAIPNWVRVIEDKPKVGDFAEMTGAHNTLPEKTTTGSAETVEVRGDKPSAGSNQASATRRDTSLLRGGTAIYTVQHNRAR